MILSYFKHNRATAGIWSYRLRSKLRLKDPWVKKSVNTSEEKCCFDFGNSPEEVFRFFGDWRYLFRLFALAHAGGFSIRIGAELLSALQRSAYQDCLSAYRFVTGGKPTSDKLKMVSSERLKESCDIPQVVVHLDGSASVFSVKPDFLRIPFGVHPKVAASEAYTQGRISLGNIARRNVRILNAGSAGEAYNNAVILSPAMEKTVGRNALINAMDEGLDASEHRILTEPHKYYSIYGSTRRHAIGRIISLRYNRSFGEWLYTLALSDCYLCLPGRLTVLCHNVYEAMSVGTIPILQYGHWFNPELIDGHNCFKFRGPDDLITTIRRVLKEPTEKIDLMRSNVLSYYKKHLSEQSYLTRILDARKSLTLLLDTEWNTDRISEDSILFVR